MVLLFSFQSRSWQPPASLSLSYTLDPCFLLFFFIIISELGRVKWVQWARFLLSQAKGGLRCEEGEQFGEIDGDEVVHDLILHFGDRWAFSVI